MLLKNYLKIMGVRDQIAQKCIENRRRSTTVLVVVSGWHELPVPCFSFAFGSYIWGGSGMELGSWALKTVQHASRMCDSLA